MDKKLKNKIWFSIIVALLFGILLILISNLMTGPSVNDNKWLAFTQNIISTIGQTLVGSSVVSLLLLSRDVKDFILDYLKRVVTSNDYLIKLKESEIKKLHDCCHGIIDYTDVNLKTKEWNKLSDDCIQVFKVPFCRNRSENIDCTIENDTVICKTFKLSYTLENPLNSKEAIIDIQPRYQFYKSEIKNEDCLTLLKFNLKVDDKNIQLNPKVSLDDLTHQQYSILGVINSTNDLYDLKQIYFFNKLEVDMEIKTRVPITDLSYINRLRYPTLNFRIDFTCNDDRIQMNPYFFGAFIPTNDVKVVKGDKHSFIECNDRLILPDCGASIVFNIINNNKKKESNKLKLKQKTY